MSRSNSRRATAIMYRMRTHGESYGQAWRAVDAEIRAGLRALIAALTR